MLEAVQLPAGISDLDTGLTDVDRNALPHFGFWNKIWRELDRNLKNQGVYEDVSGGK